MPFSILLGSEDPTADHLQERHAQEEAAVEERISLNEQRLGAVMAAVKNCGAKNVLDLGCGEGRLLQAFLKERQFSSIVGMDVSYRSLEMAKDRLNLYRLPDMQRQRIQLLHGSLMYRDQRLSGFDAAAVGQREVGKCSGREFRHKDHRFEWTRARFESWAAGVAERFGYQVRFVAVGPEDAVVGAPTQMAIFSRQRA